MNHCIVCQVEIDDQRYICRECAEKFNDPNTSKISIIPARGSGKSLYLKILDDILYYNEVKEKENGTK